MMQMNEGNYPTNNRQISMPMWLHCQNLAIYAKSYIHVAVATRTAHGKALGHFDMVMLTNDQTGDVRCT